jgi:putrescine transport system permease protein
VNKSDKKHRDQTNTTRLWALSLPTIWLLIFFIIPFLIVFKISLSQATIASPPYLPLWQWSHEGILKITATLGNFQFLLEDKLYILAYLNSIKIAAISTLFTLLIAYPMALSIARAPTRWRTLLLMAVILPFRTSFLLRVYAWIGLLKVNGTLNAILQSLGIIGDPLIILQTDFAVYLGIIYTYLPFMILPLYANLVKIDPDLNKAAADLGASPFMSFSTITLPLSLPGIIAGSMLVFIPAIGEFIIPTLLGAPDTIMIGRVLWDEFFANRDWPIASALTIVLLVFMIAPIMLLRNIQNRIVGEQQ